MKYTLTVVLASQNTHILSLNFQMLATMLLFRPPLRDSITPTQAVIGEYELLSLPTLERVPALLSTVNRGEIKNFNLKSTCQVNNHKLKLSLKSPPANPNFDLPHGENEYPLGKRFCAPKTVKNYGGMKQTGYLYRFLGVLTAQYQQKTAFTKHSRDSLN